MIVMSGCSSRLDYRPKTCGHASDQASTVVHGNRFVPDLTKVQLQFVYVCRMESSDLLFNSLDSLLASSSELSPFF